MTKKREGISTHFDKLTVRVSPHKHGDFGMHDTKSLDRSATYTVLATYMHRYNDGDCAPAFVITTPDGIKERVCSIFEVVECDQPARTARPAPIAVDLYAADCVNSMGDVFYDPDPDVDGYDPDELREKVESSVRYTIRKVLAALGHEGEITATLRVPQDIADHLQDLHAEYARINRLLERPMLLETTGDEQYLDLTEKQADIEIELGNMLIDMMPTMEVHQ